MSKRVTKTQPNPTPNKTEFSKQLPNRKLQALIESVNALINQKIAFSTENVFRLVDLATAVEDAFKPAARILDTYQKEFQDAIKVVADKFKEENPDSEELDEDTKRALNEIQSAHIKKVEELLAIEVDVVFTPITKEVFKTKDGRNIDLELGVGFAFVPFMK